MVLVLCDPFPLCLFYVLCRYRPFTFYGLHLFTSLIFVHQHSFFLITLLTSHQHSDGPFYYRFYADEGKKQYPMISPEMRSRVAAALLSNMSSTSYLSYSAAGSSLTSSTPAPSPGPSSSSSLNDKDDINNNSSSLSLSV